MKRRSNIQILLVIIVIGLTLVEGPTITYLISPRNAKAAQFEIDKSQFKKVPEFKGITGYINTPTPLKLANLKGKVVLAFLDIYLY